MALGPRTYAPRSYDPRTYNARTWQGVTVTGRRPHAHLPVVLGRFELPDDDEDLILAVAWLLLTDAL